MHRPEIPVKSSCYEIFFAWAFIDNVLLLFRICRQQAIQNEVGSTPHTFDSHLGKHIIFNTLDLSLSMFNSVVGLNVHMLQITAVESEIVKYFRRKILDSC